MLTKRIIACLDCSNGRVVKGIQFKNHEDIGDVAEFIARYSSSGIDELVLYNITSSADNSTVEYDWIRKISKKINIPFCVAGGIRTLQDADRILNNGADKISINTPALENPQMIDEFAKKFGTQAVVIGIDTKIVDGQNTIYKNTGKPEKTMTVTKNLEDWIHEVQSRGAGEIVINSMSSDGMRNGYDIPLLQKIRKIIKVPLIASGGAGTMEHFYKAFHEASVDGALAASVFHKNIIDITELKQYLNRNNIPVRV